MNMRESWRGLSTETVSPGERLEYWRHATNSLFPPTRLSRPSYRGFYGRVSWLSLGEVTLADIVSNSLEVMRTEEEIGAEDHWYEVNLQVEGKSAFNQAGRDVVTGPRSMVVYDSRKPYEMRFDGHYRQLSLKVPRAALRDRVPAIDGLIANRIPAESIPGRFLFDFALALCEDGSDVPAHVGVRIQQHVLDLLATALLGVSERSALTPGRQSQLDRVRAHILAHLDDPDLTPRSVAASQNMSLRSLYELFEAEDTQVAQWIRLQRLERIRRDLADPLLSGWPITTIALRRGFKDFSHFSRVFRRQYGVSPRDYRAGLAH